MNDFENPDDSIGNIMSKSITLYLVKKKSKVNKKYIFIVKKLKI